MKLKDALGLTFIAGGVAVGMLGYGILSYHWYLAACIAVVIGVCLIWSARRERRINEALDTSTGWGSPSYFDLGGDGD